MSTGWTHFYLQKFFAKTASFVESFKAHEISHVWSTSNVRSTTFMVVFVELQPRKPAINVDGFGTFVEDSRFVCVTASLEEARITKKIFTFATKINFFGSLMAITKLTTFKYMFWFNFIFGFWYYFSLFLSLAVQYDNELETEENKFKPLHKTKNIKKKAKSTFEFPRV